MKPKIYYIGRRDNPQLSKPYYVGYGLLSKTDVKKTESCLYGSMTLTPYDNETDYTNAINEYKTNGFTVNIRK